MSTQQIIVLIVPRINFAARMQSLIAPVQDKDSYPDKYIHKWQYTSFVGDDDYARDVFSALEKGGDISSLVASDSDGIKRSGVDILLGENPDIFLPSRGYQYLYVSIREEQGIYGDPDTDILVTLSFPFDSALTNNHFASKFLLEKVVEILKPKYGWSTSEEQVDWDKQQQRNIAHPWQGYSNTMIFGSTFFRNPNFRRWLESVNDDLYYLRSLRDQITYIADTRGFGNENPSWFEIELQSNDQNSWIDYEDESLSKLIQKAQQKHEGAIEKLLDSKT